MFNLLPLADIIQKLETYPKSQESAEYRGLREMEIKTVNIQKFIHRLQLAVGKYSPEEMYVRVLEARYSDDDEMTHFYARLQVRD